jgi:hypothetical protein
MGCIFAAVFSELSIMNIDLSQLERNVNLHALQPGFLNRELHYVIATDENNFRFAAPEDQPKDNELKFYCFLTDKQLSIPAGNITLNESYVLATKPAYTVVSKAADFFPFIDCIGEQCAGKAVRDFTESSIEIIYLDLKQRYGQAEKHVITSPEFQHLLIILPQVEISVSATMVYFKQRHPETHGHYQHLEEEKTQQG